MRFLALVLFCLLPSCATGAGAVDFERVALYQREVRSLRDQAVTIRAAIAADKAAGKSTETIALEIGLAVHQVVMESLLLPASRPVQ